MITLGVLVLAIAGIWLIVALELAHSDARWTDLGRTSEQR
jgi:hypothetical protein